ncbi:hypothetical protein CAI21_18400 [Alkalilimnicola ehrlichii]|uniref:diguanylate cyclase n=1 Tax=Alkalilimnicola ehrlichii TaxID=351052 RepID=A0A3E0WKT8_9GAMM|nr:GGDEF domain-containing protein [Alkalilimnicola ehrlichii]RFA25740.1 hypothetical protein CAI21_18400 [Alkalilimnicola ehrlichii]RFA32823.1 hypothetical protein CAL65_18650 [Alkalilimnicola ehrlichii]
MGKLGTFFRAIHQQPLGTFEHAYATAFFYGSIVAVVVHGGFIPLFLWLNVPGLALFNVFSVGIWLLVIRWHLRGCFSAGMTLAAIEVMAHAIAAVYFLGLFSGFHYFALALPFVIFIVPGWGMRRKFAVLVLAGVAYTALVILGYNRQAVDIPYQDWIHFINAIAIFAIVGVIAFLHTSVVNRREQELRDKSEAARLNEARLRLALKGGGLVGFDWELLTRRIRLTDTHLFPGGLFSDTTDIPIRRLLRVIDPKEYAAALDFVDRVQAGQVESFNREFHIYPEDGECIWMEMQGAVAERDRHGDPLRICGTFRDVTEQRLNDARLKRLTDELKYQALHDSLTGVLNRGAILKALDKELARCERENEQLSVVLLDIDNFKSINDSHGHLVGDEILIGVVERLLSVLRPYDHFGRYGGEEFLIIAPSREAIRELPERLRHVVASRPFETSIGALAVTLSAGVAFSSAHPTRDALIAAADNALYEAKCGGRNQVVVV